MNAQIRQPTAGGHAHEGRHATSAHAAVRAAGEAWPRNGGPRRDRASPQLPFEVLYLWVAHCCVFRCLHGSETTRSEDVWVGYDVCVGDESFPL